MSDHIFVTKPSMPSFEEYANEIKEMWESRILTNSGKKHNEFKRLLCNYLDVGYTELFTNGHMALEAAIQALGLTGEVITTPFTFASTTHAIIRQGLTPVFCDITEDNLTIDADKIEALITEKTSAIMPVHVYGNICDTDKIQKIADKYGLKVIYDAAHAFGEKKNGESIANFGDVSCFSFHATKVFNTIEGGCVCFGDERLKGKFEAIKNFGLINSTDIEYVGTNAKMNEFCAAMGICNLRHIEDALEKRRETDKLYRENLSGVKGIRLNEADEGTLRNCAYFPVIVDKDEFGTDRNELMEKLSEKGIFARKYFYPITSELDCYKSAFGSSKTPIAKQISENVLCLPMYEGLTKNDIEKICNVIKGI